MPLNPVDALLARMTLTEKIGQMCQINGAVGQVTPALRDAIAGGHTGSVINEVDPATNSELQRIAREESRLGIPLLIGRDVIHGFETVFPIPLGQAACWNPELVQQAAAQSAREATARGINWTFSPMLDIGRDPRWGRIAETFGEDPYLVGVLGTAMIRGYQGDNLKQADTLAACAKHFAGYGATESGRDYNTTNIPEIELRNVHLPPFEAAVSANVATFMAGFSDLNGVPCSGNHFLLTQVLREEWSFGGFVVSDWESVTQLETHGFATDAKEAADRALNAGLDMEMAGTAYHDHLSELLEQGHITEAQIDLAVSRILQLKLNLGLFEDQPTATSNYRTNAKDALTVASQAARESIVMLANRDNTLPIATNGIASVAVIGPLADAPAEQLGTWVFDGDPELAVTPLQAIRASAADEYAVTYEQGLESTRSSDRNGIAAAVAAARDADVAIMFVGEEAILSGEAHCRADITLPGAQLELIEAVAATKTKSILVIMAGRPLALETVIGKVDAVLYAWHPGTMAGPAITDLLLGTESPSGKLPVTFPRVTGQIPIYYAHKNSGRPSSRDNPVNMDTIGEHNQWESAGFTSFHLDAGCTPLFCFGYGLSYTEFRYENLSTPNTAVALGERFCVSADLINAGTVAADEVVQLYVRDLVGSVTRPVKELKGFQRVHLKPGERRQVSFDLHTDELAFYGADMRRRAEAGRFRVWIGGDSDAELAGEFELIA